MEIICIIIFMLGVYSIFKFVKNEKVEVACLIGLSIILKLLVKDGSFYPLYAMPILLSLRHQKILPSIIYLMVVITFVNFVDGFGVWSIPQYLIYAFISIITFISKKSLLKNKFNSLAYNFVAMFMVGILMDICTFYMGNLFGYNSIIEQIYLGIPYDLKMGVAGLVYGGLTMTMAYISSVEIKEILSIKNMTLVKNK